MRSLRGARALLVLGAGLLLLLELLSLLLELLSLLLLEPVLLELLPLVMEPPLVELLSLEPDVVPPLWSLDGAPCAAFGLVVLLPLLELSVPEFCA